MKHKLTNNIGLKFGSLLIAMIVWMVITNANNPVKTRVLSDVKIEVINEDSVTEIDKVFDIVSEDSVAIKVTERKRVLNALTKDDFTVVADMENLTELNTVPLKVTCSDPLVSWDEIEIEPSTMKVKMEQMKQNEYAVTIALSGEPVKGYEVGSTEVVQGKTVQIAGSESLLNKINQVVANVSVPNIRSDQRVEAALKIYDKNGDAFTEAQMSRIQIKDSDGVVLPDDSVMVDVDLWEVMNDIPVEVEVAGTLQEGYEVTNVSIVPATVNLVGTKEALAEINGKLTLKTPADVEGASDNISQDIDLTETLAELPELRIASGSNSVVTVNVQIEKDGNQIVNLPLSNLTITNRPEKLSLTYSPADAVMLVIHAEDESLGEVAISEILAEMDLAVCDGPGTYEVPVDVQLPEGYSLSTPITVVVTAEQMTEPSKSTTSRGNVK